MKYINKIFDFTAMCLRVHFEELIESENERLEHENIPSNSKRPGAPGLVQNNRNEANHLPKRMGSKKRPQAAYKSK